jgi:arylsulfatase A-like enzyme
MKPLLALLLAAATAAAQTRPNIVFILTDDQGYGDLGCHGHPLLKTPNIDALYAKSVRFTNYHASPTCSPTRSALMTGRHEFKNGITHTIHERERLTPKAFTLAQLLKSAGYATGIFGKWHLGDEPAYQPGQRGFDEVFIHGTGGIGQAFPGSSSGDAPGNGYFDPFILHNNTFEKTKGYCTDVFFTQAKAWIETRSNKPEPFLCWIATNAPHAPYICPPDADKPYADKIPPTQDKNKKGGDAARFLGMIANIDENVGKLTAYLKEKKLDDNTIIVFMTDNGGTAGLGVYNAGMKTGKGTPYEGGSRVPLFVSWPSKYPAGVDVAALAAHIDVFPTLADIAGAKIPESVKPDGRSLVPLLKDKAAAWDDRTLFTHVGRWEKGKAAEAKLAGCAVRTPQYRMVHANRKDAGWELYEIAKDPGEKTNVAADKPDVVKELAKRYDAWWNEVQPLLVNEDAVPAAKNAFKELFERQFPK